MYLIWGYYDSERFKTLDEKCILFVTRIKSNIKYEIIDIEGKSKVIRLVSNGYTLRLVSIKKAGDDYEHLTNIHDLPDEYIDEIYGRRRSIEEFFRTMKKISS